MKKIKRLLVVLLTVALMIGGVVLLLKALGLNSVDKIQTVVQNSGILGVVIFLAISWLFMLGQAFMPTFAVYLSGVYLFGLWQGIVLGIIGVVLGAFGLFFIGRKFGTKAVKWVAGSENVDIWRDKLTKGKYTLALLLLFPFSPDELLFVLAGITKISFKSYAVIILLTKPIGIVTALLFGGGAIIPITWAWAWLWAILGVIMIYAVWYSLKNQDKIDNLINRLSGK